MYSGYKITYWFCKSMLSGTIMFSQPQEWCSLGNNLKPIPRRDIRKLGEIVLSGFNYLGNLDSAQRKFQRHSM